MSNEQLEKNKALVARLMEEFFTGPPKQKINQDVLHELVHDDYIQHNPLAGQGPEGLRNFLENIYFNMDSAMIESKQLFVNMIAEGDMVVRQEVREGWMLIDIFRIKDGQLAEHWDALRPEPGFERPQGF